MKLCQSLRSLSLVVAVLGVPSSFLACREATDDAGAEGAPATEGGPSGADAGEEPAVVDPEALCARVAGLPAHAPVRADLALSSAHAHARYFGAFPSNAHVDGALVRAIRDSKGETSSRAVERFAAGLDGVCHVPPASELAAASVTVRSGVAFVVPGPGLDPTALASARAVVVDVRTLPAGDPTARALADVARTLGVVATLKANVHVRTGLTDEAFAGGLYTDVVTRRDVLAFTGAAPAPTRPLAVLLGARVAPESARFALAFRLARIAWLAGEPLESSVAEMRILPGATGDVAIRTMDVASSTGARVADSIPADLAGDDATLTAFTGAPPEVAASAKPGRAALTERTDFGKVQDGEVDVALARAALVSAHGASKLFFPYFGDLGDRTDERLAEVLASAGASPQLSRADVRNLLRRFGHVLEDGHNWILDAKATGGAPLPLLVDRTSGTPVVKRSGAAAMKPGDTLVKVGTEDANAWFARELGRTYGATEGFRFVTAAQELTNGSVRDFVVRGADGALRSVKVTPSAFGAGDYYTGSTRSAGWLADVGAPDVYYLNADGRYVTSDDVVTEALAQARTGRGLVIDMRGHPANGGASWDPYRLVAALATKDVTPPRYRVPVLDGAGGTGEVTPYQEKTPALGPDGLGKPVVLITDTMDVSFAEDFSMLLVGNGLVKAVVGRPTAGTTGSITGMQLPGGYTFFFTGMEARWPNGDRHFGIGVVPTIPVDPVAADYAAGKDPFLARAITAF